MVVTRKDFEAERRRFIEKGGSVGSEIKQKAEWTKICLRIPKKMINEIDEIVKNQIGLSRTAWILQTLQENINKFKDTL